MRNAIKIVLLFALVAGPGTHAFGQKPGDRFSDAALGVSFILPAGWSSEKADTGETAGYGPGSATLRPNVNLRGQPYPADIGKYTQGSVDYILEHQADMGFESITVASKADFTTSAGVNGIRVIFVSSRRGLIIRTTQYYFPGPGDKKYIVTFTALDADKAAHDKVFDDAAKTFTIDK